MIYNTIRLWRASDRLEGEAHMKFRLKGRGKDLAAYKTFKKGNDRISLLFVTLL